MRWILNNLLTHSEAVRAMKRWEIRGGRENSKFASSFTSKSSTFAWSSFIVIIAFVACSLKESWTSKQHILGCYLDFFLFHSYFSSLISSSLHLIHFYTCNCGIWWWKNNSLVSFKLFCVYVESLQKIAGFFHFSFNQISKLLETHKIVAFFCVWKR